MAKFLTKNDLLAARGKTETLDVDVYEGKEVIGTVKLRALTAKEYLEADSQVYKMPKNSSLANVGSYYFMLAKMMLNEDGSQMFATTEEGLAYLLELSEGIVSQLLPAVRKLNIVEPQVTADPVAAADDLGAKVEEAAKNLETAPGASPTRSRKSSDTQA